MELLPAALPILKAQFSFPGLKWEIKYMLYTSCLLQVELEEEVSGCNQKVYFLP
jgi:hypothetical protein